MASSVTEAIYALVNVIHDPDLDLDPDDKQELFVAVGLLTEYED